MSVTTFGLASFVSVAFLAVSLTFFSDSVVLLIFSFSAVSSDGFSSTGFSSGVSVTGFSASPPKNLLKVLPEKKKENPDQ